ncbi:hypothetical protein A1O7_06528 [Cladophialophora yegresii CBS 114405]|uniref:Heterokaryon incompatibility domain-containing protein n=1 Tax=Cladophialophora yegresii CBS 114405 TaxID=1182544 RepID=W9VTM5_9EURO|nr:uncharacterized protein A1O7_06528 [Cladophialophora yegresii CBS 114405]EXJ59097.1 hypothetical protein A1O7_06528 [Cladophialophora yegresii CBS 114405]
MDHLDRPANPVKDQFKIAYLCLAPYDGGDFLTYPSRRGFDDMGVLEGDFTRKSPIGKDEPVGITLVQSFLQSWLFFGLLCEVYKVIGRPFHQRDYISEDSLLVRGDGQGRGLTRRVNTSALPELLAFWIDSFKQKRATGELSFEDVQRLCMRIDTYLQTSYKMCFRLVRGYHSYVDEELLLSLMCLGNAIDDAMVVVNNRCFYDFLPLHLRGTQITPPGWSPIKRRWDAPKSVFNGLLFSGWCPFDIGILKRDFGINEIIYATQLRRHGSLQRHMACSTTACTANNIDEATYKTRHGTLGSGCVGTDCDDVEFDYDTICETIRSGLTPIIKSEINAYGEFEFSIVPYLGEGDAYVAISHVWAHGMGNTRKNTLPRCQLQSLHQRTVVLLAGFSAIDAPPVRPNIRARRLSYFWLDTICVPVQPANVDVRKMAISQMAQVYEQAHSVLVLDEGLLHTSLRTDDRSAKTVSAYRGRGPPPPVRQKDLVMSVMFSDWWRRLWTLQEGVLPDYLFVAFADCSMHLSHVVPAGAEEHVMNRADLSSDRVKEGLNDLIEKSHLANEHGIITVDRKISKENMEYRRRVLRLLCNRATSRSSDEPICLATLMGLDPQILLDTPPKERMQMLYACLGTLPAGLVFLPVPKLEAENFRWAPRSLIGVPISLMTTQVLLSEEDSEAEVTEAGIRLQATGYPLASLDTPLNDNFYIFPGPPGQIPSEGEDEQCLTDVDKVRSSNTQVVAIVHYDQTVQDQFGDATGFGVAPWSSLGKQDLIDPVVVLPHLRRIERAAQHPGVLVTKPQLVDGVWHARFLCNIWCHRNSMAMWGDNHRSDPGTVKNRLRAERAAVAQGSRTGNMAWFRGSEVLRDWCIS